MTDKPVCICSEDGCGAVILMKDGRCWNHSTVVSDEERTAARTRGTEKSMERFVVRPEEIQEHLPARNQDGALESQRLAIGALRAQLHHDPMSAKAATALSTAAGRLSRQLTASDLEGRIKALEELLGKKKGKR